jgi:hypothetical protein
VTGKSKKAFEGRSKKEYLDYLLQMLSDFYKNWQKLAMVHFSNNS